MGNGVRPRPEDFLSPQRCKICEHFSTENKREELKIQGREEITLSM